MRVPKDAQSYILAARKLIFFFLAKTISLIYYKSLNPSVNSILDGFFDNSIT